MGTPANTKQSRRLKLSWGQESARAPEKYLRGKREEKLMTFCYGSYTI